MVRSAGQNGNHDDDMMMIIAAVMVMMMMMITTVVVVIVMITMQMTVIQPKASSHQHSRVPYMNETRAVTQFWQIRPLHFYTITFYKSNQSHKQFLK